MASAAPNPEAETELDDAREQGLVAVESGDQVAIAAFVSDDADPEAVDEAISALRREADHLAGAAASLQSDE